MKITAAHVTNFKRIADIAITPDADRVLLLIGGKNAQGKSSLMDALTAAFGGKTALPADPVRHGADAAEIRVELDGGAMTIRRTIRNDGESTLEVRDAEGKRRSPQAALDKLVGARFLDPLLFLNMSPADQRKALLAIVDREGKVAKLDERRVRVFDRRTEVGRDHRKLEAQLEGMPEVTPGEPVDVAALTEETRKVEHARRIAQQYKHAHDSARQELTTAEREVLQLEEQLAAIATKLEAAETRRDVAVDKLKAAAQQLPSEDDVRELGKRWDEAAEKHRRAHEHNQRVAVDAMAAQRREQLVAEVKKFDQDYKTLSVELAKIDAEKAELLAANKLPVEGLDVDANGVRFRGVPLEQASGAEQLRVALALAIAASPNLEDVWVRDGALLDDESLALLAQEAAKTGRRVWVERVGDRDPGAIVIHDGRVREDLVRAAG